MSYYFSDMVPFRWQKINSITIEDTDQTFFALTSIFDISQSAQKQ